VLAVVSVGRLGYNSSLLCEGEIPGIRHLENNLCLCREWEIFHRDVELWDALLSSVLKSAGPQAVTRLEILRGVVKEMAGTLYACNMLPNYVVADCGRLEPRPVSMAT